MVCLLRSCAALLTACERPPLAVSAAVTGAAHQQTLQAQRCSSLRHINSSTSILRVAASQSPIYYVLALQITLDIDLDRTSVYKMSLQSEHRALAQMAVEMAEMGEFEQAAEAFAAAAEVYAGRVAAAPLHEQARPAPKRAPPWTLRFMRWRRVCFKGLACRLSSQHPLPLKKRAHRGACPAPTNHPAQQAQCLMMLDRDADAVAAAQLATQMDPLVRSGRSGPNATRVPPPAGGPRGTRRAHAAAGPDRRIVPHACSPCKPGAPAAPGKFETGTLANRPRSSPRPSPPSGPSAG